MAFRVGTLGDPNSGKSFAWTFFDKGEKAFAICPSQKILHMRTSEGSLLKPLQIKVDGLNTEGQSTVNIILKVLKDKIDPNKVKTIGHYIICSQVKKVSAIKQFVSRYMLDIRIIVTPDFTHYVSYIIQTPAFQARKSGGEAFARFWELAADTLRSVILASDNLREDLLDFTEFHSEYNGQLDTYELFVPAGNMLKDKFKPMSYYDIMLCSYVTPFEDEKDETKRFKFIVVNTGRHSGRGMNLFADIQKDGMIPNNMSLVVERLVKYLGMPQI